MDGKLSYTRIGRFYLTILGTRTGHVRSCFNLQYMGGLFGI